MLWGVASSSFNTVWVKITTQNINTDLATGESLPRLVSLRHIASLSEETTNRTTMGEFIVVHSRWEWELEVPDVLDAQGGVCAVPDGQPKGGCGRWKLAIVAHIEIRIHMLEYSWFASWHLVEKIHIFVQIINDHKTARLKTENSKLVLGANRWFPTALSTVLSFQNYHVIVTHYLQHNQIIWDLPCSHLNNSANPKVGWQKRSWMKNSQINF